MSTLGSGWAATEKAIKKAEAERPNTNRPFRFYLKNDQSAHLIMIDGEPAKVAKEHTAFVNGSWDTFVCPDSWFPESEQEESCPLCVDDNPSVVGYFTVMLVTHVPDEDEDGGFRVIKEIKRKNGELVKNPIQILPAKTATLEILKRHAEKRDGLAGAHFEVTRTGDQKSPNVGDIWDFEGKLSPEEVLAFNEEAAPIEDWSEALGVLTAVELREKLNMAANTAAAASAPAANNTKSAPSPKGRKLSW